MFKVVCCRIFVWEKGHFCKSIFFLFYMKEFFLTTLKVIKLNPFWRLLLNHWNKRFILFHIVFTYVADFILSIFPNSKLYSTQMVSKPMTVIISYWVNGQMFFKMHFKPAAMVSTFFWSFKHIGSTHIPKTF